MAVTITGKVKYAKHMKGQTAEGKEYEFFSFIVLDSDEGVRWPLQMEAEHKQFDELVGRAADLMDRPVKVVIRSFSAGTRKDKDSGKQVPQARFYAKDVQVLSSKEGATAAAR